MTEGDKNLTKDRTLSHFESSKKFGLKYHQLTSSTINFQRCYRKFKQIRMYFFECKNDIQISAVAEIKCYEDTSTINMNTVGHREVMRYTVYLCSVGQGGPTAVFFFALLFQWTEMVHRQLCWT